MNEPTPVDRLCIIMPMRARGRRVGRRGRGVPPSVAKRAARPGFDQKGAESAPRSDHCSHRWPTAVRLAARLREVRSQSSQARRSRHARAADGIRDVTRRAQRCSPRRTARLRQDLLTTNPVLRVQKPRHQRTEYPALDAAGANRLILASKPGEERTLYALAVETVFAKANSSRRRGMTLTSTPVAFTFAQP